MAEREFDLDRYVSSNARDIIGDVLKGSWQCRAESVFIARYMNSARKASKLRDELEARGESVSPFLIANVTECCGLKCSDCNLRQGKRGQGESKWGMMFDEASACGVSVVLLSGGEPLARRELIEEASKRKDVLFPIFTNGTLIDDQYLKLFDERRNLVPILNIEGDESQADSRRGAGVKEKTFEAMRLLGEKGIIFACSLAVSRDGVDASSDRAYIARLKELGCKAAVFFERAPGLDQASRIRLKNQAQKLRAEFSGMILLIYPEDKRLLDSCVSEGRGLYCLSGRGEGRACPYSPFADISQWRACPMSWSKSRLLDRAAELGMIAKEHESCASAQGGGLVRRILGDG
ncbi:MAG: radical SAM protein [Clostridiales bacterium]|jgi:MoaA/NifB/PqqE/SkfB family radical SAM enzyme|nr:radical SAM protein [Clostridiales bacterium]